LPINIFLVERTFQIVSERDAKRRKSAQTYSRDSSQLENGAVNKDRLELYQRTLAQKLKELSSTIAGKRVEGIRDFDETEPDSCDLCVQSYSKEQLFSLCERDRALLVSVEEALDRIKKKTYGVCEECREPIEERRLEALPWVKLCIICQSRKEEGVAA
jgi:DnaK suppressor protein